MARDAGRRNVSSLSRRLRRLRLSPSASLPPSPDFLAHWLLQLLLLPLRCRPTHGRLVCDDSFPETVCCGNCDHGCRLSSLMRLLVFGAGSLPPVLASSSPPVYRATLTQEAVYIILHDSPSAACFRWSNKRSSVQYRGMTGLRRSQSCHAS